MASTDLEVVFFESASGREVVLEVLRGLSKDDKLIVGEDIRVAQKRFPLGAPIVKPMGRGLYEVRSTISGSREFRCLFFHSSKDKALIVVHAFVKKTRSTPALDVALARKRIKEFNAS
jgi:phage-related protein